MLLYFLEQNLANLSSIINFILICRNKYFLVNLTITIRRQDGVRNFALFQFPNMFNSDTRIFNHNKIIFSCQVSYIINNEFIRFMLTDVTYVNLIFKTFNLSGTRKDFLFLIIGVLVNFNNIKKSKGHWIY